MLLRPTVSPELEADTQIRREVRRILDGCDIGGPPTPAAQVIEFQSLTRADQDDLIPGKLKRIWRSVRDRIRGILDLRAKVFSVDPALHRHRKTFVTYHEVGHDALPWHRDILVLTRESALAPTTRNQLEAEANRFAGHMIFQLGRFEQEVRGASLDAAVLGVLAERYGTSLAATARQYIIIQDRPAALLVGRVRRDASVHFTDAWGNLPFIQRFGPTLMGSHVGPDHPIAMAVHGTTTQCIEPMALPDGSRRELLLDTVYNTYNTLTLVHPLPVRSPRLPKLRRRQLRSVS